VKKQLTSGKGELIIEAEKSGLKPGTYIYRFTAGDQVKTGKVVYKQ